MTDKRLNEEGLRPGWGVGKAGYCANCDQEMPDGPDACLGLLPGVAWACCGHGDTGQAYLILGDDDGPDREDYVRLNGRIALAYFRGVGHPVPERDEQWLDRIKSYRERRGEPFLFDLEE